MSRVNVTAEPPTFLQRNLRLILALVIVALTVHDVFGSHGFIAMRQIQHEITTLRSQLDALNQDNQSLTKEVDDLKTNPKLIEGIARDEMNLARPGEYIFKINPAPKTNQAPPKSSR
jgi:cell division protein FtsB